MVARFNGGANAGHTVVANGVKYAFHLLPCGILYPSVRNVLGNGVVLHMQTLFEELRQLEENKVDYSGRLFVSDRAHLVTNLQLEWDAANEAAKGDKKIGTTKRGIGQTYASKMLRVGMRVGDLRDFDSFSEKYRALVSEFAPKFNVEISEAALSAELEEMKTLSERMHSQGMVVDTVPLLA